MISNPPPTVVSLEKTDIAEKIKIGIQGLADGIPLLMKGLEEVAKIHPAISGS